MVEVFGSRPGVGERIRIGAIAGVVGTVTLNAVTYLDMAVRGRPASTVPAQTVRALAGRLALHSLAADDDDRAGHRREALGALLGTGVGVAVAVGHALLGGSTMPIRRSALVLGGAAMVVGNAGSVATRTTDPRNWSVADWTSDVVPHLCYGLAAAATAGLLRRRVRRW